MARMKRAGGRWEDGAFYEVGWTFSIQPCLAEKHERGLKMSTSVEPLRSSESWTTPVVDEVRWQAWLEAGRARERRGDARRIAVLKCLAIAALIAAAGLWSPLATFDTAVRFTVTLAATVGTFQAVKAQNYALAVVFGALALLYNPLAPVISFSGDWQRAVVAGSVIPFVVSLVWGKPKI